MKFFLKLGKSDIRFLVETEIFSQSTQNYNQSDIMKSNDPLLPVRREVGESSILKSLTGSQKPDGPTNARSLRFENLEDRRVLSATGFENVHDTFDNSAYVTNAQQQDFGFQQDEVISYLKLLVNGEERQLSHADNVLTLVAGDTVEVSEIGFSSDATEGVFAAEGYVNKIGDLTSASLIDYNDGRFSEREDNAAATGGEGAIAGLNNSWTVEAGWDRLTINLIHYTESATQVEGRFFVNMQVGEPDFAFDTDVLDKVTQQEITVGDEVVIPGGWFNSQSGVFHNYGEVDIYHDCDPNTILWAGALVGNAGDSVEGEFVNTRPNDPFSTRWTPDVPGEYILRYYVDPEDIAAESNEDNNTYEIRLTVKEAIAPAPVAVDDTFDTGSSLDVIENDQPTRDGETLYSENFESETLGWTTDPNGTDTATTGGWEATAPVGTAWNGVELQLEAPEGDTAFVTGGNEDGDAGSEDVDGGVTSAISEALSVPSDLDATLSLKYNFAHLHNSSNEDFFRVSVVGENETEVVLEKRGDAVDRPGEWRDFSADLSAFAGQSVQLLVEAADNGDPSLVEAGIDDIQITTADAPIKVNEFSQGEHGTVTLNNDGTFNYTAEQGFSGQDSFTYNLTDGENVSNTATVNVNVESENQPGDFIANEDLAFTFTNEAQFAWGFGLQNHSGEQVDNWAVEIENANYNIDAQQLSNQDAFELTTTQNADGTFNHLFVGTSPIAAFSGIPGGNIEWFGVNFGFRPSSDGFTSGMATDSKSFSGLEGDSDYAPIGIMTGTSGPLDTTFLGLDGSKAEITLSGLPSFVFLSAGKFDGSNWVLSSNELADLQVKADHVSDTEGWIDYQSNYLYQNWDVKFSTLNGSGETSDGMFEFTTWQKV